MDPSALLFALSPFEVFLVTGAAFAALYFAFAALGGALQWVLPPLDRRPLHPGQVGREIGRSLVSVGVFALLGVVTVEALSRGLVTVVWHADVPRIAADGMLIFLWNEVHFYCSHRLLHTPWLFRWVHRAHHRSVTPTPFSTYSFHWAEAALLGSVMLTGMLLHDFHVSALVVLPVLSIGANTLGHLNADPFPRAPAGSVLAMVRRHGLHHTRVRGNFGFLLPWLDQLLGTSLHSPRLRLPRIVSLRTKQPVGLLILVATIGLYFLTNHLHLTEPSLLVPGAVDRATPLVSWTVWIYASYPLLFLTVFALERDALQLNRYLYATLALNVISNLCFILWPSVVSRPPLVAGHGLAEWLLGWIRTLDSPASCLPSLHVSTAFLSALVLRGRRGFLPFLAWAIAIAISTLTTKQHHFVDVVGGVLLAALVHRLFFTLATYEETHHDQARLHHRARQVPARSASQ